MLVLNMHSTICQTTVFVRSGQHTEAEGAVSTYIIEVSSKRVSGLEEVISALSHTFVLLIVDCFRGYIVTRQVPSST